MSHPPERIAAARAAIQRMLEKHKRLDFKGLEPEIRAILGDPGASYERVVEFFAECGVLVKLGSVHEFCIPRNIRPVMPGEEKPAPADGIRVVRRRPRS